MHKILHASRVKALTHSIMKLFTAKNTNITLSTHKDIYFKHYYLTEDYCKGIDFIAEVERTSKRGAVLMMLRDGMTAWVGSKIADQIKLDHEARERNEKAKRTRFAFILRKLAREKGWDISKFI